MRKTMEKIAAIIPAYNEEENIGRVLKPLKEVDVVDEIIVVSDGSTDNTIKEAQKEKVRVLELTQNIGKGGAIKKGIESTDAEIVLLLDADLIGLKPLHITNLISPLLNEEAEMTIGIFRKGRFSTDLAQVVVPGISGQRALRREILIHLENLEGLRFGLEAALTRYVRQKGIKTKKVFLEDLTHSVKEEKMGVIRGVLARLKMYWEILKQFTTV